MIRKISRKLIALNVLYAKKKKLYPAYVSKHNPNHKKQVIFLLIPDGEGDERKSKGRWHDRAVKSYNCY